MRWTKEMDEVLEENAYLGLSEVREILYDRFRIFPSVEAIKHRMYRIRVSASTGMKLKPKGINVCANCYESFVPVKRNQKVCKACIEQSKVDFQNAKLDALENRERAIATHREYERVRKAVQRKRNNLC